MNVINDDNNSQYIEIISASVIFTKGNKYFCHLLMMSFKYMVKYYSHVTFSYKFTVNTKIMICNYVVTTSAWIYLFHIFLQISNNNLSPFNVSLTIRKGNINTVCQEINI